MRNVTKIMTMNFQSRFAAHRWLEHHGLSIADTDKIVNIGPPATIKNCVAVPGDDGRYSIMHIDDV